MIAPPPAPGIPVGGPAVELILQKIVYGDTGLLNRSRF